MRIGFVLSLLIPGLVSADSLRDVCADAAQHYATLVHASYVASLSDAGQLDAALHVFVSNPDEVTHQEAKDAWRAARPSWLQTEAFRYSGGPIDGGEGPESMINGWPMDESYVDAVRGAPQSGIIQDPATFPMISADLLESLNEKAGETTISCGYHAIEFLLWGQDWNEDGPGERPFTDYTTARHSDRRGEYLLACSELLQRHISGLVDEWAPEQTDNFRARFLAGDPRRSIWMVLVGLKTMAGLELAGERLLVAWDTRAQEDEHSCFSDNTTDDILFDTIGMRNVFLGRSGEEIAGPGIEVVARELDPVLTPDLRENVDAVVEAARGIPHPFDQAILSEEGRSAILHCVELLEEQSRCYARLEQLILAEINRTSTE